MDPINYRQLALSAILELGNILYGKEKAIRLSMATFLAGGHLLIEDIPGVGKTTLAKGLARVLGLEFKRIQLTNETLPTDIIGTSIYRDDLKGFTFLKGPVFTQILLADEINRASPRTQSALLEAMEEGQVTAEGQTHKLPTPFFVIATQNPVDQAGTHPLPESQLDRFAMCINLGYPDHEHEKRLYVTDPSYNLTDLLPVLGPDLCQELRHAVSSIHASEKVVEYLMRLVDFSRTCGHFALGLSPRAGLWLLRCARAWAFLEEREFVLPEDIQVVFPWIVNHRLYTSDGLKRLAHDEAFEYFKGVPCP